jgi:hypothetical protein
MAYEKNQISSTTLSAVELGRLRSCEAIVEKGLGTFFEVGTALAEIRAGKLYRQDYDTFEDYCRGRWQMAQQSATRLIRAAETVANLKTEPIGSLPTHESQVRPLTKLRPDQQREAWSIAIAQSPNPTAADVERAVQSINGNAPRTIRFKPIVAEMSPKDILYRFGRTYVRKACNLIDKSAEEERPALIALLLGDSAQCLDEIRDHFIPNSDKESSFIQIGGQ